MTTPLPLSDIRILEIGNALAVPLATRFLADMGADVIKVESLQRPEVGRGITHPEGKPGAKAWETGGFYQEANRNKSGITLNLDTPEGRTVLSKLVADCDVVVENYAPRVMSNWGIDYEWLRRFRDDVIYLSSSGFGQTGPWREYKAYGMTLAPTAGLSHFTGYADSAPIKNVISYTDSPAAMMNAFAIMCAIEYRSAAGKGQRIDSSQYEIGVSLLAEGLIAAQVRPESTGRNGNQDPIFAPHNVYPCGGEAGGWIAIVVHDDFEWSRLCAVLGMADRDQDPRFLTVGQRWQNREDLDELVASHTVAFERLDLQRRLQAKGVSAGAVNDVRDLFFDPQLRATAFFERVEHSDSVPEFGARVYPGAMWSTSRFGRPRLRCPAPTLGQHNESVLSSLAGITTAELEELEAENIIGSEPTLSRAMNERYLTIPEMMDRGMVVASDPDYQSQLHSLASGPEERDANGF